MSRNCYGRVLRTPAFTSVKAWRKLLKELERSRVMLKERASHHNFFISERQRMSSLNFKKFWFFEEKMCKMFKLQNHQLGALSVLQRTERWGAKHSSAHEADGSQWLAARNSLHTQTFCCESSRICDDNVAVTKQCLECTECSAIKAQNIITNKSQL